MNSKNQNTRKEKTGLSKAIMVATGVSLGVALSAFVVIGNGVKDCLKALEGLTDNDHKQ